MSRIVRALFALALCLACLAGLPWSLARSQAPSVRESSGGEQSGRAAVMGLGIWFHVAQREGADVAPASFIADELAQVNAIYEGLGLRFVDMGHSPIPTRHARLDTRADRDLLAPYLKPGVVNCFVTGTLMDVDEAGRERRGVHWHAPGGKHYVILSAISGPYVLAHELGHFFGNPRHSDTPGNLMSYTRTEAVPFLDELQIARVQRTARQLVKKRELVLQTRPRRSRAGDRTWRRGDGEL